MRGMMSCTNRMVRSPRGLLGWPGWTMRRPYCSDERIAERRKRGFWQVEENRKAFIDRFKVSHGIRGKEDWRSVTAGQVRAAGGAGLLTHYKGSMVALLLREVEGMDGKGMRQLRKRVPNGYWKRRENRRAFLDEVAMSLGVQHPPDWRNVSYADVCALGGSRLLHEFGDSLFALLLDTYGCDSPPSGTVAAREGKGDVSENAANMAPDVYRWRSYVPQDYWQDTANLRAFLEFASATLGICGEEDWLRLSKREIEELSGAGLLREMSLSDALRKAFPEKQWNGLGTALLSKRARQRHTRVVTERLFPSCTVLEEHRVGPSTSKGGELVLDIFLPELSLAIEYNGEQHYHEVPIFGPLEVIQRRDREKAELCAQQGIRLFTVPYWWDGQQGSLLASLHHQFPTVLPSLLPRLDSSGTSAQAIFASQ